MKHFSFTYILYLISFTFIANSYLLITKEPRILFLLVPLFLFINVFAGVFRLNTKSRRLKISYHGALLLSIFVISVLISIIYHIVLMINLLPDNYLSVIWSVLLCICLEAILFWNGIICVYLTSVQLGIKQRVIGIICGMIPIANLIALRTIIKTVFNEVAFETAKEEAALTIQSENLCATQYPLLMVHGVFFRDSQYFNYWGRIPKELELHGAKIYYGNHQSAASVPDSASELAVRIKELVKELGCEKLNIIAHSKGGLDCRYALSKLGIAPYVASLTTINTPHRGCEFADYVLTKLPENIKDTTAAMYNGALKKFGDTNPDFIAAVSNLTASYCTSIDNEMEIPDGVYCQSVGSIMPRAGSGKFPLNFSYHLVKYFDGPNDGLVSAKSFQWGENYTLVAPPSDQSEGISHGDMIDLNRHNIPGFDVREFYVNLVSDLKNRGL